MRIMIIGGISRSLINFRGPLIRAITARGHEVVACAGEPQDEVTATLESWGVKFIPVKLARAGMSPIDDLRTLLQLRRIMREQRPDMVLSYTIKPVIWGGFAARLAGVPVTFSLVTGLGYAFMQKSGPKQWFVSQIARLLYKLSLRHSQTVFFQNPDDMRDFTELGLIRLGQGVVVNGSGLDINHFSPAALPLSPVFLLIGRLLADKGIREYANALEMLRAAGVVCAGLLVGKLDSNPASVRQQELDKWTREKTVDYRGPLDDVRPAISESSVYVLPSYREGTPRTVLEAMAMGRPIITTDAPGCRETVRLTSEGVEQKKKGEPVMDGENGFLVRVHDAYAVAAAMKRFVERPELIRQMGVRSRQIAEEKYDVRKVNEVILRRMNID